MEAANQYSMEKVPAPHRLQSTLCWETCIFSHFYMEKLAQIAVCRDCSPHSVKKWQRLQSTLHGETCPCSHSSVKNVVEVAPWSKFLLLRDSSCSSMEKVPQVTVYTLWRNFPLYSLLHRERHRDCSPQRLQSLLHRESDRGCNLPSMEKLDIVVICVINRIKYLIHKFRPLIHRLLDKI